MVLWFDCFGRMLDKSLYSFLSTVTLIFQHFNIFGSPLTCKSAPCSKKFSLFFFFLDLP